MPSRRSRFTSGLSTGLPTLALLFALIGVQQAHAGMFDDDEARRQVQDLTIKTNERLDTLSKAQFELVNQIQALREENARLRGQIETLNFELESAKKRQQDFYIDLDGRLRKLETQPIPAAEAKSPADETKPASEAAKAATDPVAESREYETALNFFKVNKIKEAATAFEAFTKAHPDSSLTPNAQYWLGNAHSALRDCKKSIEEHRVVVNKWPQHPKAPDALIGMASCQQELGDTKGARTSLETVLLKYPDSSAAATAKQRLKK